MSSPSSSNQALVSLNQIAINAQSNFINFRQKLLSLSQKYMNVHGADDARADFFMVHFILNIWLLIQFDSFLEVLDRHSNRLSRYIQLNEDDRTRFMSQYDTITRASYCTKAMFEVEHFLHTLANRLDGIIASRDGYWKMTERLQKSLNLKGYQFKVLNTPALVRNSLHNDGYHNGKYFKVVIRGKSYEFVSGKQVNFSGWDNLYIMFDELIDVIDFIVDSTKVKQLPKIPRTSMI